MRNGGTSALNFATTAATVTVVVTPPTGAAQTFTTTVSTGTVASGATLNVTLPGTLNMTALGTYSFAVTATAVGDLNPANNVLTPAPTRTVVLPVAGTLSPATYSICVSGTASLVLAGAANGNLQLQSSTSATGTFTDVAGATSAAYTTPVLTATPVVAGATYQFFQGPTAVAPASPSEHFVAGGWQRVEGQLHGGYGHSQPQRPRPLRAR